MFSEKPSCFVADTVTLTVMCTPSALRLRIISSLSRLMSFRSISCWKDLVYDYLSDGGREWGCQQGASGQYPLAG